MRIAFALLLVLAIGASAKTVAKVYKTQSRWLIVWSDGSSTNAAQTPGVNDTLARAWIAANGPATDYDHDQPADATEAAIDQHRAAVLEFLITDAQAKRKPNSARIAQRRSDAVARLSAVEAAIP